MPRERGQEVRERAYAIWEHEGRPEGHMLDHWLRAEAEVVTDDVSGTRNDGKREPSPLREPGDTANLKARHAVQVSAFQRGTGVAIKDVLVCLNASETSERHLRLAANLSRQHRAHLTAAYLLSGHERTSDSVYGPGAIEIGIVGPAIARIGEERHDSSNADREGNAPQHSFGVETAESHFRETLQLTGITGEWYIFDPGEVDELIAMATAADLVIVGQHNPETPATAEFRPEKIVVACGRPLLVLPYIKTAASVGKRVLVAWDGTREATRAVHDSLPLIAEAEAVTVIAVGGSESDIRRRHASLHRVVRHLERHGLVVCAEEDVQSGLTVSDLLLSRATDLGADLIVAGAYHHSRFREAVLGGVSRELLNHMTVPVLMSH
jgi:nucleotide-binding universal stress UspA family protein